MKSVTLLLFFLSCLLINNVVGKVSSNRLPTDLCSMRTRVFQTLGIPPEIFKPLEFPVDGRDQGLDFIRLRVKALYPFGTSRREILRDLQRVLDATKDVPGREIREDERHVSLQISFQSARDADGEILLVTGHVDFSFDTHSLLEDAYYVEVTRPRDSEGRR